MPLPRPSGARTVMIPGAGAMKNPLDSVLEAPAELLDALRRIPEMAGHTGEMAKRMAGLERGMKSIGKQTTALPDLNVEMAAVRKQVEIMDGRMEIMTEAITIAMPAISKLPEMIEGLDEQLAAMVKNMERLLDSLDQFDESIATLQASIEPIGRIAGRMPGGRAGRKARAEALAAAEEAAEADEAIEAEERAAAG